MANEIERQKKLEEELAKMSVDELRQFVNAHSHTLSREQRNLLDNEVKQREIQEQAQHVGVVYQTGYDETTADGEPSYDDDPQDKPAPTEVLKAAGKGAAAVVVTKSLDIDGKAIGPRPKPEQAFLTEDDFKRNDANTRAKIQQWLQRNPSPQAGTALARFLERSCAQMQALLNRSDNRMAQKNITALSISNPQAGDNKVLNAYTQFSNLAYKLFLLNKKIDLREHFDNLDATLEKQNLNKNKITPFPTHPMQRPLK